MISVAFVILVSTFDPSTLEVGVLLSGAMVEDSKLSMRNQYPCKPFADGEGFRDSDSKVMKARGQSYDVMFCCGKR